MDLKLFIACNLITIVTIATIAALYGVIKLHISFLKYVINKL